MIRVLLSCSFSTTVTRGTSHLRCCRRNSRNFSHVNDTLDNVSSARARHAVQLLPTYLADARSVTKYHPTDSPDGALQLSVAENLMLEDLLVPWLRHLSSSSSDNFEADQIYYQPTHGRLGLRHAMAGYLTRLLHLELIQPSIPTSLSTSHVEKEQLASPLDVNGIVIGAGCNAVLENLCFCLTEPGDAVLIPTPYYAAFDFDLGARVGLKLIPVSSTGGKSSSSTEKSIQKSAFICPSQYYPTRQSLDAAYSEALKLGHAPRVLLLSHPNNPLGICYPPSVVKECIEWARERQVHLISDEIYAGSVYRSPHETQNPDIDSSTMNGSFQSILQLAATRTLTSPGQGLGLGPYIHFVYALSKDFALSGLRVGVAYSENESIRLPLQKLNDLCQVSSQTQCTVERMLNAQTTIQGGSNVVGTDDKEYYWSSDVFLEEGRSRIRNRCDRLQKCLQENDIPFIPADSGMFVWMDLTEFLPASVKSTNDGMLDIDTMERQLYLELLENGLLFTPGRSMQNESPGFFRCVFTAATDEGFDLALSRITKFIRSKRNSST